jgi:hypothetical protein
MALRKYFYLKFYHKILITTTVKKIIQMYVDFAAG